MVAIFGFTPDKIIAAVQDMYEAVATAPERPFHFPVGREASLKVGYPAEALEGIPEEALRRFAGVGYPFRAGAIRAGDTVLDIGAGAGTDTLIASRLVGPRGRVIALDITPAMVGKLRELLARRGIANVEVIEGNAESIPLPDAAVDVVTSNGMLNLVPDKRAAIREIFRVLRPGGRVQIADIVLHRPVTPDCGGDPRLWAECVVGATVDEDYLDLFRDAGFDGVEVLRHHDYFALSRSADTRDIARRFGARAVEITMRRAQAAPSPAVQWFRRADPRRLLRSILRRGWGGALALVLSVLTCYGTLAAVALVALAGHAVELPAAVWAGAIVAFAVLAVLAVANGMRRHGRRAPLALALPGLAGLAYVQFVNFSAVLELVAFALLASGVGLDMLERRRADARTAKAVTAR
jgi:SAM-dependent methyltransferase